MVDHRAISRGARQVARQAMVVAHIHQQCELAVEQVGNVGDQGLEAVHGEGDMPTVEVPAMQHAFFFGIDDRVVVGAVQFDLDERAQPVQAVRQYAEHVGRAAQRITVLQAMQGGGGRVDGQVFAQPRGDLHLPRVWFGGEQALVEVFRVALQGHHIERGDARGQLQQIVGAGEGQAGQAGHHRGAVHQCQGFLGAQDQRLPAQLAVNVGRRTAFATE